MSLLSRHALLGNQNVGEDLLFDVYPSTIPSFSLNKCLAKDFIGETAITVTDNITERSYSFGSDGSKPTDSIISDYGSSTVRVKRVYAHNTYNYYEQTTFANMPIISESGSIIIDSEGNVSLKFTGAENMEMPSSTSLFNSWHNGDISNLFTQVEKTNASSTLHLLGNRNTSGGSTGFAIRVRSSNRFNIQIYSFGNQGVFYQPSSLPADDSRQIWIDIDADATIAADRSVVFSDGNEFSGNTRTEEVFTSDANTNMQLGTFDSSTARYQGYISCFGGFDSDQSANRLDILSYL